MRGLILHMGGVAQRFGLVGLCGLVGLLALAGCSGADEPPAQLESTDQFQATSGDFGPREEMPGAALYGTHCASCHAGQVPKAPHLSWLEMMTPAAVSYTHLTLPTILLV